MYTLMRVNKDNRLRTITLDLFDFENNHNIEMTYSMNTYYHKVDTQLIEILDILCLTHVKFNINTWNELIKQIIKHK